MGVLNLTPDSFYDGNRFNSEKLILSQVEKMLEAGATFIDLGAYSSKPNAALVSEEEESKRLLPTIALLVKEFSGVVLSIDTFRSSIARASLLEGAAMINDISAGLLDEQMMRVISDFKVPYVMMHMRGTPQTMASLTNYDDLIKEIIYYFSERTAQARSLGIYDLIIDPGFGFAKTLDQNYELLRNLDLLQNLGLPILVGLSRKSMIYKLLDSAPNEALNGTTVLNTVALTKGASILRVHDVKEALECVTLCEKIKSIEIKY
jgi:dihydropteroate synthase